MSQTETKSAWREVSTNKQAAQKPTERPLQATMDSINDYTLQAARQARANTSRVKSAHRG